MSTEQDQDAETPRSKIQSRNQSEAAMRPARPTPASVFAYILVVILAQIVSAVVPGYPPFDLSGGGILFLFLRLLVFFLLINRSVLGWIVAVLVETVTIIIFSIHLAAEGPGTAPKLWVLLFLTISSLALLLTRPTRQHIWAPDPELSEPADATSASAESAQSQADSSSSSSSSDSSG